MPSRRSNRGKSLRSQLQRAEKQQEELRQAIEDRKRWEDERDHLYRTGWENWDMLDNETRQDLVRESAIIGGLSTLGDAATSPRRLGVSQGAREILKRIAPGTARKALAGKPRKAVVSLMDRLRKVRNPQEWSRANQERWAMVRPGHKNTKFQQRTERARTNDSSGPLTGPPSNINTHGGLIAGSKPKTFFEALTRNLKNPLNETYKRPTGRDAFLRDLATYLSASMNPYSLAIRDSYYRAGGEFDYIQNLSNKIVPVGTAEHEQGGMRISDDDWKKKRGLTGVSQSGSYFGLDGRPTKEAKKTGATNMWDVPLDKWNEYFRNEVKEDSGNKKK